MTSFHARNAIHSEGQTVAANSCPIPDACAECRARQTCDLPCWRRSRASGQRCRSLRHGRTCQAFPASTASNPCSARSQSQRRALQRPAPPRVSNERLSSVERMGIGARGRDETPRARAHHSHSLLLARGARAERATLSEVGARVPESPHAARARRSHRSSQLEAPRSPQQRCSPSEARRRRMRARHNTEAPLSDPCSRSSSAMTPARSWSVQMPMRWRHREAVHTRQPCLR